MIREAQAGSAPGRARLRRGLLLAGTVLTAAALSPALLQFGVMPAFAGGGAGSAGDVPAGRGGGDSAAGNGGNGGNATSSGWAAGGGGAGVRGGNGGNGFGATGAPGGGGGLNPGDAGADATGGSGGRGGGGGGAHGYRGNDLPIADAGGGAGGKGGSSTSADGGGGGAGGYGAVVESSGDLGQLDHEAAGGNGGAGGNTSIDRANLYAGNGGSGGIGLRFTNPAAKSVIIGADVTGGGGGNAGSAGPSSNRKAKGGAGGAGINGDNLTVEILSGVSVTGGNGGARDPNDSTGGPNDGAGGGGITGSDLSIVVAGTIEGGMDGDNLERANAITFAGGTNRLELLSGYVVTGLVDADDGTADDVLALGGSADGTFDVSAIGAQYLGFSGFEKTGTGTWTLTGTTAATTPWTLTGGVLSVADDASLGTNAEDLTFDGGILQVTGTAFNDFSASGRAVVWDDGGGGFDIVEADNTFTVSDVLGGAGGLTKLGAGTLVLTGDNSFSGGVTLDGGTISVGHDNALGTGLFTVESASTLDIQDGVTIANNADLRDDLTINVSTGTGAYRQDIAESGGGSHGISKTGDGTLELTGANSYSGDTIVEAGVLQAGANGAFSATSAVTVEAGATLDLYDFDQIIGGLAGAGKVALGTAGLTVDQAADTDFAGAITGTGSFTKTGAGELVLSGVSSAFTGQTFVNEGLLSVNGDISASALLTVAAGGALGGNGLLPSIELAGGRLTPGNSIGTLTVEGDLTFGAGSTYAVEIDDVTADRTVVTGTATLTGGTVATDYATATYVSKTYTILSADGGLGGTRFTALQGTAPTGFTQELAYDGGTVSLVLDLEMREPDEPDTPDTPTEPGTPDTPTPPSNPDLPDFGDLSRNQDAVRDAIVGYFDANGGIPADFAALSPEGLSQVSGEARAGAVNAGIESADRFLDIINGEANRLGGPEGTVSGATDAGVSAYVAQGPDGKAGQDEAAAGNQFAALDLEARHAADPVDQVFAGRWSAWGAAYGGSETIGGDADIGSHDTETSSFGLASGFSARFEDTVVGVALGGGRLDYDLSDDMGSGEANVFNAGLYGRQGFGDAYLSSLLAYGFYDFDTSRAVPGDTLSGSFNAQSWSGRVEGGYRFDTPLAALTPYAAFQAIAFHAPGYAETSAAGGSFALAYEGDTTTALRTELGLKLDRTLSFEDGSSLTLSGRAAWAINAGDDNDFTAAFQTLPGTSFVITRAEADRNAALIDAGAEYRMPDGLFASLAFQGEFSGNVQSYAGKAKIGFTW